MTCVRIGVDGMEQCVNVMEKCCFGTEECYQSSNIGYVAKARKKSVRELAALLSTL